MNDRVPNDDVMALIKKIEKHIQFLRVREYAMLVMCGDLVKEKAAKHLQMSLEAFESWLDTWKFISKCLDEGKDDYETSHRQDI